MNITKTILLLLIAFVGSLFGQHPDHKKILTNGTLKNLGPAINTEKSESAAIFVERDSIVFYKRKQEGRWGLFNLKKVTSYDINMSIIKNEILTSGKQIDNRIFYLQDLKNSKENEFIVGISSSERTIIINKENQLWYSRFKDQKWQKPVKFSKNINIGKEQHSACLSADENTIYFSSNASGSDTSFDLYSSSKNENGNWSKATILSAIINTSEDEDSPFITEDGKGLYFSSKGHNGMGGYDVFYSENKGGEWSKPLNLGAAVNSTKDDLYFRTVKGSDSFYLTSDREGGFGELDVYEMESFGFPKFENCKSSYGNYSIEIDATASIDEKGIALEYEWEMGDGAVLKGEKITHIYKRPGTYDVKLNAIDAQTGRVIMDEDMISLEGDLPLEIGKDKVYLEAFGAERVAINSSEDYTTKHSQIPNGEITHIYWKFNSEEDIEEDSVTLKFDKLGEQTLYLEVLGMNENGEMVNHCLSQKITVVTEEQYKSKK